MNAANYILSFLSFPAFADEEETRAAHLMNPRAQYQWMINKYETQTLCR